jgi:hypothetical protein
MNKNNPKKINFKNFFRLKKASKTSFYYGLVIIAAVAGFASLGLFLYHQVYRTIIQAEEIHILQQKVVLEMIDTKTLDKVLANMQTSRTTEEIKLEEINDPFRE